MPHPPNRLNAIRATRHQTKVFAATIRDQDGRLIKASSVRVIMTIGSAPPITKRTGDGIESDEEGRAIITLGIADTGALAAGMYAWDLWIEYPDRDPPERYPVVRAGKLEVTNGITTFT